MDKKEFKAELKYGPELRQLEKLRDATVELEKTKPTEQQIQEANDLLADDHLLDSYTDDEKQEVYRIASYEDEHFKRSGDFGATVVEYFDSHIIFDTSKQMTRFIDTLRKGTILDDNTRFD